MDMPDLSDAGISEDPNSSDKERENEAAASYIR
jgi:hypothetical protein